MRELPAILDRVFDGDDRLSRDELYRRALAADAPIELVTELYVLAEGGYARRQLDEALRATGSLREGAG